MPISPEAIGRLKGLLLPALLIAAWELGARSGGGSAIFVPFSRVVASAWELAANGDLAYHLAMSLSRLAGGFVAGAAAGFVLGAAMALSRLIDRLLGPIFHAYRQVAAFAWLPLIGLAFGLGWTSLVAFIALSVMAPVMLNTYQGIRAVAPAHLEVARALRLSRWRRLVKVILPSAAPAIFTGIELATIYAWLSTVGAEYLIDTSGRSGIGGIMELAAEQFRMDIAVVGIFITGVIGYTLAVITHRLRARLLPWATGFGGLDE